ncbi:PREDICTED: uncharacterized protein LOC108566841 [Nicrophorus vespilloides]|uniref:Uncharacterized protein LOC108566841 n=1 Tax=Nicrophorus vespilloides TaxID=110193 RepID=A0ABM1N6F8_NICVS|nr:PREDICTED: uncharacterized protein LOC108566841 [Nicrophorus vespilloides]
MAPREKIQAPSSSGLNYYSSRDDALKNSDDWLADKRNDDQSEGLWRIHDDLYDLTDYVDRHPGGKFWLKVTKGTDITEAFETHHILRDVTPILSKFHVRKAFKPRHSPYTFHDNGFYRTLKRNVKEFLKDKPKVSIWKSKLIIDVMLLLTFALSILAAHFWSYTLAVFAGYFLACVVIIAHNFFHQRDNFRMHYFNFGMETREWRISHVLSHHMFTNTIYDMEVSVIEPFLEYLPVKKSVLQKIFYVLITPLAYATVYHISFLKTNWKTDHARWPLLIKFILPLAMYVFTDQTFLASFGMWNFILLVSSAIFGTIGLNAAHHHPDIFHDGDAVRDDRDWGISQLDTVMDRRDISGLFLVLTNFGDHGLHHLFPTFDHATLDQLYPVLRKTCKDFNIDLRVTTQLDLVKRLDKNTTVIASAHTELEINMAPREKIHAPSSSGLNYYSSRDDALKNSDDWLADKINDDQAEGLWRIHDELYDLTDYVDRHPGGKFWLKITKGTDITEAFETHHIFRDLTPMLSKFHVRKASKPRHSPFTFHDDGFYRTLKRNVKEFLKDKPKVSNWKSKLFSDIMLLLTFTLSILAAHFWSYTLAVLAGYSLTCVVIIAHNFFHQRDNFRMHYFNLAMETREWRISHVLSHHLLTNTIYDMEISLFEPMLEYLPVKKSFLQKIFYVLISPLTYATLYHISFLKKVLLIATGRTEHARWPLLIKFILPLAMYIFTEQTCLASFGMWNFIILVSSAIFGTIGLNAAHHHPEIFHDGDAVRDDRDWGISQLDTVMDRRDISGLFLVLTNFGDHCLHHMFPTFDHATLDQLYPVLRKTCKDFNIDLRVTTQLHLVKGQFEQLLRTEPNKKITDLLKYSKKQM